MAKSQQPKVVTKKHLARLQREKQQIRLISYIAIGVVIAVVLLITFGVLNQTVFKARQPVAKIGTESITTRSFQAHVRLTRQQMIDQYIQYYQLAQMFGIDPTSDSSIANTLSQIQSQLDNSASLGEYVLNQMIDAVLLRLEAPELGVEISQEELEQTFQGAMGYFPDGKPTPTATPTSIIFPPLDPKTLALITITPSATSLPTSTQLPTSTPEKSASPTPKPSITPTATEYTLASYQENYSQAVDSYTAIGFTEEEVTNLFRDTLLRTRIYDMITADVPRTSEQVWARHILVADLVTAKTVRSALIKDGDWLKLGSELSVDTASGVNGGDVGWFGRGVMVAEFEAAAFDLKIGEISQPIKTQFGYHIIQVLARADRPLTAEQYKSQADQTFSDYLLGLRTKYNVEIFDYYLDRVPTDPTLQSAFSQ